MTPLLPALDTSSLQPACRVRVLYADTDKFGIVYHANYLRYLELARVEFIRAAGLPYTELEAVGLGLPLTDMAAQYRAPALYDDQMTIKIGISVLTRVRIFFDYQVVVAAGDRAGLDEELTLLFAQTRHACVRREDGRPDRLPVAVYERLRSCYKPAGQAGSNGSSTRS